MQEKWDGLNKRTTNQIVLNFATCYTLFMLLQESYVRAKNKAIRVQKNFKTKYNMYAVFSVLKTAVSVMSCCRIQRVSIQFCSLIFYYNRKKTCVEGGYYEVDENIGNQSKI